MTRTRSFRPRTAFAALLALCIGTGMPQARAQPESQSAAAANTGVLRWSTVVEAPVERVWEKFATEDGIESWMAPQAELDLRVGGTLRTNYNPDAKPDDPSWIVHRILAYEPGRMLSMKTVSSPRGFPHAEVIEQSWGVIRLEPIGPTRTRVGLASCGWGEGPAWDEARAFFDQANTYLLGVLRDQFNSNTAQDPARTMDALGALVGGDWIHASQTAGSAVVRVRNRAERFAGGRFLVVRGWLGSDKGLHEHALTVYGMDPESRAVRFWSFGEDASVAGGEVTLGKAGTIEHDWQIINAQGERSSFRISMLFQGADEYEMMMEPSRSGTPANEGTLLRFYRVRSLPEGFGAADEAADTP